VKIHNILRDLLFFAVKIVWHWGLEKVQATCSDILDFLAHLFYNRGMNVSIHRLPASFLSASPWSRPRLDSFSFLCQNRNAPSMFRSAGSSTASTPVGRPSRSCIKWKRTWSQVMDQLEPARVVGATAGLLVKPGEILSVDSTRFGFFLATSRGSTKLPSTGSAR
jgi:hypothetical protein